jgi:hypothetical protein
MNIALIMDVILKKPVPRFLTHIIRHITYISANIIGFDKNKLEI